MARSRQAVTDAELAVLRVLWGRGPLTARGITEAIYPDGGQTEFASVHSFLARLERKGLVTRDRSGFVHIFAATASQEDVAGQELAALADKLAGGSLAPFLMHLIDQQRLTEEEAGEIRRMLDAYEPAGGSERRASKKRGRKSR
jgi:predicted transcriptional regulator